MTVKVSAADGRSWIPAKDHNGRLLFDGLLKQGDSKTFQDSEKINLVARRRRRGRAVRQRQGQARHDDSGRGRGLTPAADPYTQGDPAQAAIGAAGRARARTAAGEGSSTPSTWAVGRARSSLEPMPERRTVALVTLGCARNEVDSEELAGRLAADGWQLVEDAADADVAVVNTCGFVDAAKKDSVDALLEANDLKGHGRTQAVVAVGLHGRAVRQGTRRGAARGGRRARLRRLRRHLRPPAAPS